MTPVRVNTVGRVRAAATAVPMATCINVATNLTTNGAVTVATNSAADMAESTAADIADTQNRDAAAPTSAAHPVAAVATDRAPAMPARALVRRRRPTGTASRIVAVVGLLAGLSWCLPAPAMGQPVHLTAAALAVVSAAVGAWRPGRALGEVVLAAPGDPGGPAGSGITIEAFAENVQWFIVGILGTLTITFFMIGFARLIAARGQSEEYGKARESLKSALYGFLGVMLTPAIVGALQSLFTSRGR